MLRLLYLNKKLILLISLILCFTMYLQLRWRFFVQEKHMLRKRINPHVRSATFVTALYDIGRAKWGRFNRTFRQYLNYFTYILQLKTNLIICCDEATMQILKTHYGYLLRSNVYTIIKPFHDIEYEKYRQNVTRIMESEEFKKDNIFYKYQFPEAFSVDYILLMNNKVSFLKEAIAINPFQSTHFFWIDAGYGHGNRTLFPESNDQWTPTKLITLNNSVTYITLAKNPYIYKGYEYRLQKMVVGPILNGAFFGGDKQAVLEYYYLYNRVFRHFLFTMNNVDDDQSIAIACFYQRPQLFNLVYGGWVDVIKLFS